MNGAQALIRTLVTCGVDVCFTNPGTSEMHFVAALDDVPEMRGVLGLFEGVVTGAADGYARVAGKPGGDAAAPRPRPGQRVGQPPQRPPGLHPGGEHRRRPRHCTTSASTPRWRATSPAWPAAWRAGSAPRRPATTWRPTPPTRWPRPCPVGARSRPWCCRPTCRGPTRAARPSRSPRRPVPTPTPTRSSAAVAALRSGEPAALLVGGRVVAGEAGLVAAARVAAGAGAKLLCETFPARLARGAGLPEVERLGYLAEFAEIQMAGLKHLVVVDTKAPVSFFAYPGKASELTPEGCEVHVLGDAAVDPVAALLAVADELGAPAEVARAAAARPDAPTGALDASSMATALGHLLPEGAIVSDEGNTAGLFVAGATAGCAPHDWLTLTGGSIGQGMPVATGAAVAAGDRKVVNLQADGSALYTIQSLWTQAREGLDVTTILLNNRSYAILNLELSRVGAEEPGPTALSMLDLSRPDMDFCSLAKGMGVPAERATTAEDFTAALERALATDGPALVEVMLPAGL